VKMFDAGKTRMIGLPYGEKNYNDMLSCFHMVPERNGRTDEDRQTDGFAISISRVSMLTRDKNTKTLKRIHVIPDFDYRIRYHRAIVTVISIN